MFCIDLTSRYDPSSQNNLVTTTYSALKSLKLLLNWLYLYLISNVSHSCVQVLHRSRLSSPSMVFKGESPSQDSHSPSALFEACSETLDRIAREVKQGFSNPFKALYCWLFL